MIWKTYRERESELCRERERELCRTFGEEFIALKLKEEEEEEKKTGMHQDNENKVIVLWTSSF